MLSNANLSQCSAQFTKNSQTLILSLNIGPDFLNLTYLAISIFLLIRFRRILKLIGLFNLVISISFLGLSIFFDGVIQQIFNQSYELTQFIEEGFKFIGIACWLNFWCKASSFAFKLGNS